MLSVQGSSRASCTGCSSRFARRGINLTKIERRPSRRRAVGVRLLRRPRRPRRGRRRSRDAHRRAGARATSLKVLGLLPARRAAEEMTMSRDAESGPRRHRGARALRAGQADRGARARARHRPGRDQAGLQREPARARRRAALEAARARARRVNRYPDGGGYCLRETLGARRWASRRTRVVARRRLERAHRPAGAHLLPPRTTRCSRTATPSSCTGCARRRTACRSARRRAAADLACDVDALAAAVSADDQARVPAPTPTTRPARTCAAPAFERLLARAARRT